MKLSTGNPSVPAPSPVNKQTKAKTLIFLFQHLQQSVNYLIANTSILSYQSTIMGFSERLKDSPVRS